MGILSDSNGQDYSQEHQQHNDKQLNNSITTNLNQCNKCFRPFYDDHKSTATPLLCKCFEYKRIAGANVGWICPNCGTGLSPYTSQCNCKRNYTISFDSGIAGSGLAYGDNQNIS